MMDFKKTESELLKEKKAVWTEEKLLPLKAKRPERKKSFVTSSDIQEQTVYLPTDQSYFEKLGFPGAYPFTRGIQPNMYRGKFWTMRQYAGFGDAEESNRRYRYLLSQGTTGLSVAFDLPTQIGYDSDHEMAAGEVGKVGVAIDSLEDMERLLDGLPLDKITTSMTINATAIILLAFYVATAEKHGFAREKIGGTLQNDILKEYVARGTYAFPPGPSVKLATDIIGFCAQEMPRWNAISISGYHIREAGSSAVQELAFTLAHGKAYVQAALERGMDVDIFAPRLSFFFNVHNHFFEEIAKFRAARRMWARMMREEFRAKNPKSWQLRFHAQTAGSTLTAQQSDNNVARVSLQAMAAVLGGTQSLHTNSRDEALCLPAEESARIALRTQQIIAYETGVTDVVDPLGGSFYVEQLTDEVERGALVYMEKIDSMGGALAAIEKGYIQSEIQKSAYEYQKKIESKEQVIVGVNEFKVENEKAPSIQELDPELERKQKERLRDLKQRRDRKAVTAAKKALESAARADENLVLPVLDAAKSWVSLGEIVEVLRDVYGSYQARESF